MKKIFITAIVAALLAGILMTGCGRGNPEPAVTPAASSAPVASGTQNDTSNVLQSEIPLEVTQPADGAEVYTDTIVVKGQTVAGATVSVNDTTGTADSNGDFSITINLEEGLNAIDVIAIDSNGKQGEVLILVNVVL